VNWEHVPEGRTSSLEDVKEALDAVRKDVGQLGYNLGRMHEDIKDVRHLLGGEEGSGWLRCFLAIGVALIGFGSALSAGGLQSKWTVLSLGIVLFAAGVVLVVWARHLARLVRLRRSKGIPGLRSSRRKFDEFDRIA
jgi:hypothetical protein